MVLCCGSSAGTARPCLVEHLVGPTLFNCHNRLIDKWVPSMGPWSLKPTQLQVFAKFELRKHCFQGLYVLKFVVGGFPMCGYVPPCYADRLSQTRNCNLSLLSLHFVCGVGQEGQECVGMSRLQKLHQTPRHCIVFAERHQLCMPLLPLIGM